MLMILIGITPAARADVGPKPSMKVHCTNLPAGEVYLDLLIDDPPVEDDRGFRFGVMDQEAAEEKKAAYNSAMIAILESYNVSGWRPALVTGTHIPLWAELRLDVENGAATASFDYMGVPSRFKIIVVTESGGTVISNVVETKAFQNVVNFDYATGKAAERSPATQTLLMFAVTSALTLLIEGLILKPFKFSFKKNWRPFLFVNLITQILLSALLSFGMLSGGMLVALFMYMFAEIAIVLIEMLLFIFLFKEQSKLRRAMYGIVANIASFIVGFFLWGLLGMILSM